MNFMNSYENSKRNMKRFSAYKINEGNLKFVTRIKKSVEKML